MAIKSENGFLKMYLNELDSLKTCGMAGPRMFAWAAGVFNDGIFVQHLRSDPNLQAACPGLLALNDEELVSFCIHGLQYLVFHGEPANFVDVE